MIQIRRPKLDEVFEAYGQLPLSFEANRGQVDSRVDFILPGTRLYFVPDAPRGGFSFARGLRNLERIPRGEPSCLPNRRENNSISPPSSHETNRREPPFPGHGTARVTRESQLPDGE